MRVLCVDDNAANREVLVAMLAKVGLQADQAEDAVTGLVMIDRTPYDLVLMDFHMPTMDGLTALRQIRALPGDRATLPVLVVTADMDPALPGLCAEAGADGVLLKPVDLKTLLIQTQTLLAQRARAAPRTPAA